MEEEQWEKNGFQKKNKLEFARIISHTSFGFLVLFIGLNYNFSSEKDFNLKLGETQKFDDYSIKFQDLKLKEFRHIR